jgi:hypothetical protein
MDGDQFLNAGNSQVRDGFFPVKVFFVYLKIDVDGAAAVTAHDVS